MKARRKERWQKETSLWSRLTRMDWKPEVERLVFIMHLLCAKNFHKFLSFIIFNHPIPSRLPMSREWPCQNGNYTSFFFQRYVSFKNGRKHFFFMIYSITLPWSISLLVYSWQNISFLCHIYLFFCFPISIFFHNSVARTDIVSVIKWIQEYSFRNTQDLE